MSPPGRPKGESLSAQREGRSVKRRALLVAAALLPAACATGPTQPASTAPTQRFGVEQFYSVDPAVLRAAVLTDTRALFQAVDLDVSVKAPAAPARYVIRLRRSLAVDPRLAPAPAGQAWQVFALTTDDALALVTVRQLLLSQPREQAGEVGIVVTAQPALVPAALAAALPLRIDMLVDNRAGWFTQVEQTLLDTRKAEKEKKG